MRGIYFFFFTFTFFCLFAFSRIPFAFAKTPSIPPKDTFMTAQVQQLQKSSNTTASYTLQVKVLDGQDQGQIVKLQYDPSAQPDVHLQNGDTVVIAKVAKIQSGQSQYYFVDQKRTSSVVFVVIAFLLLIILIAGWKGIGSILGLGISIGVIFLYIVPQIINGADPLTVCMIGAIVILFVTTYVAHGLSKQTTVGLVSTLLGLLATFYLSQFIIHLTLLNGYGNEQAAELRFGLKTLINLKGLLLGGILLSTIGALNDITITQAATIFTLHQANPNFSFGALWSHGFQVGREHAISLVNTLVLAYAGTALALFIFLLSNPNGQPWWVIVNSEFLNEEIMRTIAGTAGLLLSVPIATFLATTFCNKKVTELMSDFIYAWLH